MKSPKGLFTTEEGLGHLNDGALSPVGIKRLVAMTKVRESCWID